MVRIGAYAVFSLIWAFVTVYFLVTGESLESVMLALILSIICGWRSDDLSDREG